MRTPREFGPKRILVTGGAGFIGSHLCARLVEQGHDVLCIDNFYTGTRANLKAVLDAPNFEFMRHDVTFPLYVEADEIYNLACPASPVHYQFDPVQTTKTSVHGAINMLGLAKRIKCRILQASTSEVYGDPQQHPQREEYWGNVNPIGVRSCYDEGKRCAETLFFDYHRQHQVQIKVARIFNTYGPHMHPNDGRVVSNFIMQALQNQPITLYGSGEQTRSFCYVDDLVDGLMRLMNSPEKITGPINLGNPGEFTMRELAELVVELSGSKSKLVKKPLPPDDPKQRQPDIAGVTVIPANPNTGDSLSTIADATSTALFYATPTVKLAVAFTEPLTTVNPTATFTSANGTALTFTGSGNGTLNNSVTENGKIYSLVRFDVNDVRNLEADGRGSVARIIDFAGSAKDAAGNPVAGTEAAANQRVLVRDFKAPLMTLAYRTATGLTFVFDEPVRLAQDGVVTSFISLLDCAPGAANIDLNTVQTGIANVGDRITISADGKTVMVPVNNTQYPGVVGGPNAAIAATSCFPNGGGAKAYAEPAYAGVSATAPATPNHGVVVYDQVRDRAAGTVLGQAFPDNSWQTWDNTQNLAVNALRTGIGAPMFAAADLLGPFLFVKTPAAFAPSCNFSNGLAVAAPFQCEFRTTHQLRLASNVAGAVGLDQDGDDADADNNNITTDAELVAYFAAKFEVVTSAGVARATLSGVSLLDSAGNTINTTAATSDAAVNTATRVILRYAVITAALSNGAGVPANADRFRFVLAGGNNNPANPAVGAACNNPALGAGNATAAKTLSSSFDVTLNSCFRLRPNDIANATTADSELNDITVP